MKLFIDSADNLKTIIKLDNAEIIEKYQSPRQQRVLEVIEKVLKKKKAKLEDISEIEVNLGPGSFTGLRVGCTIANTLGWVLKVPVNGGKAGQLAEPNYS